MCWGQSESGKSTKSETAVKSTFLILRLTFSHIMSAAKNLNTKSCSFLCTDEKGCTKRVGLWYKSSNMRLMNLEGLLAARQKVLWRGCPWSERIHTHLFWSELKLVTFVSRHWTSRSRCIKLKPSTESASEINLQSNQQFLQLPALGKAVSGWKHSMRKGVVSNAPLKEAVLAFCNGVLQVKNWASQKSPKQQSSGKLLLQNESGFLIQCQHS